MKSKKKLKCFLCDNPDAKIQKLSNGGIQISCKDCTILGIQSYAEREAHGVEMNIFKPETFKNKPASSIIWLLAYCKVNVMTKH